MASREALQRALVKSSRLDQAQSRTVKSGKILSIAAQSPNEVEMPERATPMIVQAASSADIRRLCGDVPDWKVASIAALLPTQQEVELAAAWADRDDEACEERAIEGKSAQVFDILTAGDDVDEER